MRDCWQGLPSGSVLRLAASLVPRERALGDAVRAYRRTALLATIGVIATALATLPIAPAVAAATVVPPGELDPNFGNFPGEFVTGSGFTSALDSTAVDSQGRILVGAVGSGQLFIYR